MLLKWFTNRLLLYVRDVLLSFPQFAYLAGRNTHMAIHKVLSFLEERKRLAGSPQPTPWQLKAGFVQVPCTGCLVISLDLRQAFDRLDRCRLLQFLHDMRVPEDLIGIMQHWHVDTKYILQHGKSTYDIPSSRGVRQGCTAAPVLWLIYIHHILLGLQEVAPLDWTKIVTAFADDLIFCFEINCVEEVYKVLSYARHLLTFLAERGLDVNQDKTQYLFKLFGSKSSRVWRELTYMQHGKRHLRLTSSLHPCLTDTLEYLGVVLAWRKCGDEILKHRMMKARGAFALLRPWWRASAISTACKDKIYKTMVLPVLMYGLGSGGISAKGEARLTQFMVRHLSLYTSQSGASN